MKIHVLPIPTNPCNDVCKVATVCGSWTSQADIDWERVGDWLCWNMPCAYKLECTKLKRNGNGIKSVCRWWTKKRRKSAEKRKNKQHKWTFKNQQLFWEVRTLLQPTLTTGHRIAVGMATNCPKATVSVGRTRQAAPRIVLSSMAYWCNPTSSSQPSLFAGSS